jgi:hypothetical protein
MSDNLRLSRRRLVLPLVAIILALGYVGAYFAISEVRMLPLPAGPTPVRTMSAAAYSAFAPLRLVESVVTGRPPACRDCK